MTLDSFKTDRSKVIPKLHDARKAEQSWKTIIEEQRLEYSEARDRCGQEEDIIKHLDSKVEYLREKTQVNFGQVIFSSFSRTSALSFISFKDFCSFL